MLPMTKLGNVVVWLIHQPPVLPTNTTKRVSEPSSRPQLLLTNSWHQRHVEDQCGCHRRVEAREPLSLACASTRSTMPRSRSFTNTVNIILATVSRQIRTTTLSNANPRRPNSSETVNVDLWWPIASNWETTPASVNCQGWREAQSPLQQDADNTCLSELVCSWRRARRGSAVKRPCLRSQKCLVGLTTSNFLLSEQRPLPSVIHVWFDWYPPHMRRRRSEVIRQFCVSTYRPHDRKIRVVLWRILTMMSATAGWRTCSLVKESASACHVRHTAYPASRITMKLTSNWLWSERDSRQANDPLKKKNCHTLMSYCGAN